MDGLDLSGDTLRVLLPNIGLATRSDIGKFRATATEMIQSEQVKVVSLDISDKDDWNSLTLSLLKRLVLEANKVGVEVNYSQLPRGAVKILSLSKISHEDVSASQQTPKFQPFFTVGQKTLDFFSGASLFFKFIKDASRSLLKLVRGKASFQGSDFKTFLQAAGPDALVIVGVVNLLLGVILAFMGAVQLKLFGAEIFVANLVSLGHTREIAPMMTAIVLAGRTGAAYAAQLGTMQVNEEIDALTTFGFSPMDFLVLPRMLALALMTPLLVLYGDAIGMFGGYLIGVTMLDLGTLEYINQTRNSITVGDIGLGVFKGSIFGILVAITGCREGMASGRSASAVGDAATRAVVNGILAIIIATAAFAVISNWLGI